MKGNMPNTHDLWSRIKGLSGAKQLFARNKTLPTRSVEVWLNIRHMFRLPDIPRKPLVDVFIIRGLKRHLEFIHDGYNLLFQCLIRHFSTTKVNLIPN